MNILFIEDEAELQASGVAQLEAKGHTVFPTNDIAESRAILNDESIRVDLIISDHRLPDGFGIEFMKELREKYPTCNCAIVSGCLTSDDVYALKENNIPYFRKPLLYAKVLDEMRRKAHETAPINVQPEPPQEPEPAPEPEGLLKGWKKKLKFWSGKQDGSLNE